MSIENISAGLPGVAKLSQRPAKNALISNTDNPAVQQYAQVSLFTAYLPDAPQAVGQNQSESDRSQQQSSGFDNFFGNSNSNSGSDTSSGDDAPAPVLNYNARGVTTPVQKPSLAGQFLSVSV